MSGCRGRERHFWHNSIHAYWEATSIAFSEAYFQESMSRGDTTFPASPSLFAHSHLPLWAWSGACLPCLVFVWLLLPSNSPWSLLMQWTRTLLNLLRPPPFLRFQPDSQNKKGAEIFFPDRKMAFWHNPQYATQSTGNKHHAYPAMTGKGRTLTACRRANPWGKLFHLSSLSSWFTKDLFPF